MADDLITLDSVQPATTAPPLSDSYTTVGSGNGITMGVRKGTDDKSDDGFIPIDRVHQDFQDIEAKKGPVATPADNYSKLDTDFENQGLASAQFTTPDVKSHAKNLLGTAQMSDSGEVGYKDDKGNYQSTDSSKHVILKDPDDGSYKVYNRTDDTNEGPIMGRVLGFGRILGQGFASAAPETVASVPGVAAAAVRQGIDLPKGIDSSVAPFISKVPLANRPLTNAADTAIQQTTDAVQRAAKAPTGEIVNPQQAGETARSSINAYAAPKTDAGTPGVLAQRVNDAYDNVRNSFTNPTVTHEPANALQYASQLQQKYGKADLGWPKTLSDSILGPITKPGGVDYDSMKLVRQKVGEMIENPSLIPEGTSPAELKGLYGSLSDDLKDLVVKAGGNKALAAFTRANTYNKLVNDRRETLQRVLGTASRSDEGIFGKILQFAGSGNAADAKTLAVAKKSIGEEGWRDIAGAAVNQLGKRTVKGGGETFSLGSFAQDYGKLSPAGRDALFGSAGYSDLRQVLDDLGTVTTHASGKLANLSNPSGIAHTGLGWFGVYEGLNALREAAMGGGAREGIAAAGVLGGSAFMSKILSSPLTARNAARWLGAYQRYKNAPGNAQLWTNLNNTTQVLKNGMQYEHGQ